MQHPSTIRLVQQIYNAPFLYVSKSEASLSLVKNWTKNPLMMLRVLSWPLIMSPSDQFMAVNGVLVETFQFLLLAQVATKNRFLTLFYRVLNSLVYVILVALFLGVAETN